jgi:hypothetical protein
MGLPGDFLHPLRRRIWVNLACFLAIMPAALGQAIAPQVSPENGQQPPKASQQDKVDIPDTPEPHTNDNTVRKLPSALLHDQIGLWTSPSKVRFADTTWMVPLGGLAAAFFVTDSEYSRHLSNDPNRMQDFRHVSDYGLYSMIGAGAGSYFLGLMTHNEHQRETGFLSGQAAIDTLGIVEALKYATGRQRPIEGNGNGEFWKGGVSFPSVHSAEAWSIAGIIAHEYSNPFVKFLSYGLATTVSVSRINAKEHFPSDVLIGAALGYLTSEYVYRKHHNPEVPGAVWDSPVSRPSHGSTWPAKAMGSPYVPLDSWVYPAMSRLAAMGFINSAIAGMRPWTRMECARQLSEASDRISDSDPTESEPAHLYQELMFEFGREVELLGGGDNAELRVRSVYTRATGITGKPLTDAYHFGETIYNDFGRPEQQGFNNVSGISAWATNGPFAVYVSGEYQHSPEAPALPLSARQAISLADFSKAPIPPPFPVPPDTPTAEVNRGRLLDSYVAMNMSNWQFSYGKQSIRWGADEGGGVMLSDNADPVTMFRINRVTPFILPSFLRYLGPMRVEFFIGQYSGYEFMFAPARQCNASPCLVGQYGDSLDPQPIIHGERFSFKPTANFEFGLSRTTDYGGPGYPLTWHNFARSLFSTSVQIPGAVDKTGSHRSGLDFSYRIHNALTFYADGMTEHDNVSPLIGPDVAAWLGGIYIPRLPKLSKMDFRAEGVYTDPPIGGNVGNGYFYYDPTWVSGFTNKGQLMGDWVGRQGQGVQTWLTYWFTPRNTLQFEFRHLKVSNQHMPNGGTQADGTVRANFWVRSNFSLSAAVQYETWNFPVLSPTKQSDVTTSLQLTFWPKGFVRKSNASQ